MEVKRTHIAHLVTSLVFLGGLALALGKGCFKGDDGLTVEKLSRRRISS